MIKLTIEKELLARFSDSTFVIACILSSMLIFLSFYLSVRNYSDLVKDYNGVQELNRKVLKAEQTYDGINRKGIGISKPPEVLSIFSTGITNYIGRDLNINSFSTPQLRGSKVEGNPIFAIFGDLDLTFIVKSILSLLAIVFSYNILSGEKEVGTLRLIFSFPVPRDALILGKLIGGLLCLLIPLFIPIILGIAVILLLPNVQFVSDDWLRLILILGIFLLYLTVFFLMGAFVSARTKSSSVSFLIALFIWVLVVLVIPKSSSIIAAQFIHVPSSQQYRIQKGQLIDDIFDEYHRKQEQVWKDDIPIEDEETARERFKKRYEQIKRKMSEIEEQRDTELDSLQARMDREYQRRQQNFANLAITLSRISPASTMTQATMNFADTGTISLDHFIRSARAYRERYIAFIKDKMGPTVFFFTHEDVEDGSASQEMQKPKKPNTNEIPVFRYKRMSIAYVLRETIIDILLLVLLSLLFWGGTYVSFLKYDVR